MKRVVAPKQMAKLEAAVYEQGIDEGSLMEEAGKGVAHYVQKYCLDQGLEKRAVLLCGKGNNAGDAYVTGVHLLRAGYKVTALEIANPLGCSTLCQQQYYRFMKAGGQVMILSEGMPPEDLIFQAASVIVDGIFGTGFHGKITGLTADLIKLANASKKPIISIDIPSGLNGETGNVDNVSIQAEQTVYLGFPKIGFFINDGWDCVGRVDGVDLGLPETSENTLEVPLYMMTTKAAKKMMPAIKKSRHKYQAGYVVGIAGSKEYPGAALLSSLAALRGGAGIVRLLYPFDMAPDLQSCPYELIKTPYHYDNIEPVLEHIVKAKAVFIGPGMGRTPEMQAFLRELLPRIDKPCVIDADAIHFLANNEQCKIPKNCIFTPHRAEMAYLLKTKVPAKVDFNFLKKVKDFAAEKEATVILKGGPSFIAGAVSELSVNPTGDPGMATAGSGDVLTGLLASLLAQGVPGFEAALLGVFIHGKAGEFAADERTSRSMIAGDILEHFAAAWKFVQDSI